MGFLTAFSFYFLKESDRKRELIDVMQGVEETFRTLHNAFAEALHFFLEGAAPNGAPLTQQQAVDVLDVYDTLLSGDDDDDEGSGSGGDAAVRAHIVRLSLDSGFLTLLASVLAAPLAHVHEMDAQSQQPFLTLRMKASGSLLRLLVASSDAGEQSSAHCYRVIMSEEILPLLLRVLAESPHEVLRIAVGETLFVFVLRVSNGPTGFIAAGGVSVLCRSVAGDSSGTLRSVCASVLRNVVAARPLEFTNPGTVAILVAALADSSGDVRALAAEILEQALRQCPDRMSYALQDSRSLLAPLQRLFAHDESVEAVEAAARLAERCCTVAAALNLYGLFASAAEMDVAQTLLRRIAAGGNAGAACARALRMFVQYTPPSCELPRRVLRDAAGLKALLKGIVDAGRGRTTPGEDYAAFQVKSVELALCLCVILSQAPAYRAHLAAELAAHPNWAAALKNAAVSLLNAVSLEYFAGIELQDVTGCHLNALRGVAWAADHTPECGYVQWLFRTQMGRAAEAQGRVPDRSAPILPRDDVHREEDQARKVRLTFAILVFSINTTFPVDSQLAIEASSPAYGASVGNAASGLRAQPSASPRFTTASRQREYVLGSDTHRSPAWVGGPCNSRTEATTAEEREAVAVAYDKFNSSMAFVLRYTLHYGPKQRKDEDIVETDDGYLVHTSKLKNPWRNIVENQRLKTWEVQDLKVRDLFYFSIPFDDIGEKSLETVIHKARRHMIYIKKEMMTTPQSVKGRRWFLHDMMRNIMPNALKHLKEMKSYVVGHGGDSVRFPIFLFREKELHFGERALHPGNMIEVIDQIAFYFSQSTDKTVGVDNARLQQLTNQLIQIECDAYMKDINYPSATCPATTAATDAAIVGGDNDYDEGNAYGHGTISSDSEPDD